MLARPHYKRMWCGCCDLKSAAMVAGTFVMTISFVQFLLVIFNLIGYGVASSWYLGEMLKTVLGGYVGLAAMDLLMIIISIIMLERNARQENKTVLLVWLIMMSLYILYETALNISYFILAGGIDASGMGGATYDSGMVTMIGLIVYWILKLGMYIAAMVAVHWRWHELMKMKDAGMMGYAPAAGPGCGGACSAPAPAPTPQVVYGTAPQVTVPYQVVQQPAVQQSGYVISQTPQISYKY